VRDPSALPQHCRRPVLPHPPVTAPEVAETRCCRAGLGPWWTAPFRVRAAATSRLCPAPINRSAWRTVAPCTARVAGRGAAALGLAALYARARRGVLHCPACPWACQARAVLRSALHCMRYTVHCHASVRPWACEGGCAKRARAGFKRLLTRRPTTRSPTGRASSSRTRPWLCSRCAG